MKKVLFIVLAGLVLGAAPTFGAIQESQMQALMAQLGIVNTSQGVDNGGNVAQSNAEQQGFDGKILAAESMSAILMQAGIVANPGTLLMSGTLMEGQTQMANNHVMSEGQGAVINLDTAAAKTGAGTAITGNNSAITNAGQVITGNGATTVNALAAAASQFVGIGPGCCNPAAVLVNTSICVEQSQTIITPCQPPTPPCPPQPPCPPSPPCGGGC